MSLGVRAVEIQLPPALTPTNLGRWTALTQNAIERGCTIAIHAPLSADDPLWPPLMTWLQQLSLQAPLVLITHGCTAAQPEPTLIPRSVAFAQRLLADLPSTVTLALELGWNSALRHRPGAALRRTLRRWQQRQGSRPTGVGSGMGAAHTPQPLRAEQSELVFDPELAPSLWRRWRQTGVFSATGSREATLQIVEQIDRPNCTIAWDLAHDWLAGTFGGVTQPGIPSAAFLARVGYVRLHDVSDDGHDHWPLVVGNVPYTSQLRALLRHGFDGPVCVAVRYPAAAQSYGDRWQTLERSLTVARQTLRLY